MPRCSFWVSSAPHDFVEVVERKARSSNPDMPLIRSFAIFTNRQTCLYLLRRTGIKARVRRIGKPVR